ncbi:dihydrolipoyl dehydrogenase [Marinicella gelatinilytica]|uniref:dihydrolipoyl dehydrogenase n=1 Tax=Marinicella gelatinilytica TaxID=2996017 RepID=UPI0038996414
MSKTIDIKIPDIGDFDNVPVIEVLVAQGDQVEKDQSLLTLESEKATMEIPSPEAGTIVSLTVSEGDNVAKGAVIGQMEVSETTGEEVREDSKKESSRENKPEAKQDKPATEKQQEPQKETDRTVSQDHDYDTDLVVIGAGPGGYTAAFRAADLGLKVTLVERYDTLGGVCLNVGCIPSKALLHTAAIIRETESLSQHGVVFKKPDIDREKLLDFKNGVVSKLTGGLAQMAKQRKVTGITGEAQFIDDHTLQVGDEKLTFNQAIIAVGSRVFKLPDMPWDDERLMDSTDALDMKEIPKSLLIIGGGIIGLEMAAVYSALGSKITVVEMMDQLIPGADKDLVNPLHQYMKKTMGAEIKLKTKVTECTAQKSGLKVTFDGDDSATFDRVLVAVGRRPNGDLIAADKAGVKVDDRGFIAVDKQMRTNVNHIFAIGDVVGQPMLAHKASHEAKIAAEAAAGEKVYFDARVIPSVAYTDPEVAWVGLTEHEAKEQDIDYEIGKFPWAASGRAIGNDRTEGFTKLLFDPETEQILGAGIVGTNAGELISELCLAIEMGCEAADISLTIHPHPTLAESVAMSAEAFEGTITDMYLPKKK